MTYQYAVRRPDGVLLIRKLTRLGAEAVAEKFGAIVTKEETIQEEE